MQGMNNAHTNGLIQVNSVL